MGILVYTTMDGSSSFALPITAAQKIQQDFLEFKIARHGWTGMTIDVLDNKLSPQEGIGIRDVFRDSPGHLAGIHSGDTLLKIGNKNIKSASDVINATFYLSVGETVNFTIRREEEIRVFPVKVFSRPTDEQLLTLKPVSSSPSPGR